MNKKVHTPTEAVAKNATKGLQLREKFGHGGTIIGMNIAKGLSKKEPVDDKKIRRIKSYFARHEVDKKVDNFGNEKEPSKGYIAWLLWGGDAGKEWAEKITEKLNDKSEK